MENNAFGDCTVHTAQCIIWPALHNAQLSNVRVHMSVAMYDIFIMANLIWFILWWLLLVIYYGRFDVIFIIIKCPNYEFSFNFLFDTQIQLLILPISHKI